VSSTPFSLFQPVILAPVRSRTYSSPATLFCLTRKIKIIDSRSTSNDTGDQRLQPTARGQAPEVTDNRLRPSELACLLMRFDQIASVIVKANHSIM
jgi:hypothetical protein